MMIRLSTMIMAGVVATTAAAEPFAVQGQLRDNGTLATGAYDFQFSLWDASASGTQIGSTVSVDDLAVSAGVFSTHIDFGQVFTSDAVWVEVSVRDGASTGTYSMLPARIQIGSTPKAHHALTADELTNPQWNEAPGILWYGSGTDRVLINRSTAIAANEVFGIQNNGGFSGMVVSSPSDSSQPYIALAANNSIDAYQWYDGSTDSWVFWKSGAQRMYFDAANSMQLLTDQDIDGALSVSDTLSVDGNAYMTDVDAISLLASGDVTANEFNYDQPRSRVISTDLYAFAIYGGFIATIDPGGGSEIPTAQVFTGATGSLRADVDIPDGVTLDSFDAYCLDESSTEQLIVTLHAESYITGAITTLGQITTSGSVANAIRTFTYNNINHTVDNSTYFYYYDVVNDMGAWDSGQNIGIRGVVLHYSSTTPH